MIQALRLRPRISWPPEPQEAKAPRPAILLFDSRIDPLGQALADRGMTVLRTPERATALDLVRTHRRLAMAVIHMNEAGLDPVRLIAELHGLRPDLWIGMLEDGADRDQLAAGYAAGGADILQAAATPEAAADRVIRSLPSPGRLQELGHRRRLQLTREQREEPANVHSAIRKARRRVWLLAGAATLGVLFALVWQSVLGFWEQEESRSERLLAAIEGARLVPERGGRQVDRLYRDEELQLKRGSLDAGRRLQEYAESRSERRLAPTQEPREVPDRVDREFDRLYRAQDLQWRKNSLETNRRLQELEIEEAKFRDLFRKFSPRYTGEPSP